MSKTKCDIYFKKGSSSVGTVSSNYDALASLIRTKGDQLIYDETDDKNLRFIGKNPDNYVNFNNEIWRIIGVMYNVEDENGNIGNHLKIIRDSIGEYSWDSSPKSINEGEGVNEWSTSAIAKVLNENYYKKEAGGICYGGSEETIKECPDWESIGLNDEARSMISKIKWKTGAIDTNNANLSNFYRVERTGELDKKMVVLKIDM